MKPQDAGDEGAVIARASLASCEIFQYFLPVQDTRRALMNVLLSL